MKARVAPDKIRPDDPRYAELTGRGFNKRFAGRPAYVRLVGSTEQVVEAVQDAVRNGLRLTVRSGGHCLEGFVADPAVRVLIDTSLMTAVYHDPEMSAFAVEAGVTLGEVYRKLFLGWGVTIPAGESPDIGMGGHVVGGAFGFLCRQHGLAADYLSAVEVVVVDDTGTASSVVATREPSDPNRELWWAHTGGGGGNFGIVNRRQSGKLELKGLSTAGGDAERLFETHLAAINDGVGARCTSDVATSSWLAFALNPFPELFKAPGAENASFKIKDAFLRKRFTDRQIKVAYDYLTRTDHDIPGGMLGLATYGGAINTVRSEATASAQRDSILTTSCTVGWMEPRDEARNLAWVRAFYRDLHAETGGAPVPGEVSDGAFINHPDADLADPEWNTSGVPWHTLYYKDNYARLQQVKARWDPRNVFHHALSIRLP